MFGRKITFADCEFDIENIAVFSAVISSILNPEYAALMDILNKIK